MYRVLLFLSVCDVFSFPSAGLNEILAAPRLLQEGRRDHLDYKPSAVYIYTGIYCTHIYIYNMIFDIVKERERELVYLSLSSLAIVARYSR